ncbi:hypothetical protein HQ529_06520 [Candidatus Woesearchaeota archaeon]|nr:hypothetical protein [Candidatus Woesearchaeota archaeon]
MELNFFDSMESLEPKCPNCNIVLDYGTNTEYVDKHSAHVCLNCDKVLD